MHMRDAAQAVDAAKTSAMATHIRNQMVEIACIRTSAPAARELDHGGNHRLEIGPAVIATAADVLPRACVMAHRFTPVEQLVAATLQQQVALRMRDALHDQSAHLGEMSLRELITLAGVQILLRPDKALERR